MKKKQFYRLKGKFWEYYALVILLISGYRLVAKGRRGGGGAGEIDLLVYKSGVLVAVEVKYRKKEETALACVSRTQRQRQKRALCRAAAERGFNGGLRNDLFAIWGFGRFYLVKGAF